MSTITEIAPDVYRISTYVPEFDLQFNQFRDALTQYQASPLRNYMPYTPNTERLLAELAALRPKTLAAMHGSTFVGDGEKALLDLGPVLKEILGS